MDAAMSEPARGAMNSDSSKGTGAATLPTLPNLPEELVSNIAIKLGSDDLFNLRLTCRALNSKTWHDFALEYFSSKCFMLTSDNLNVLLDIAKHRQLSRSLRTIYVSSAFFFGSASRCPSGCGFSVRQDEAFKGYVRDQESLKSTTTNRGRKLLASALALLPALESLELIDHHDLIVSSDTEIRGLYKVWRTTGTRAMLPPTNGSTNNVEYNKHFRHLFRILTTAVAESGVSLKHFGVVTKSPMNGLSIKQDFAIKPKTLQALTTTFKKLKSLSLSINGSTLVKRQGQVDDNANLKLIHGFASTLGALDSLHLNFDASNSTASIFQPLMRFLDLNSMSKLYIDGLHVGSHDLAVAVTRLGPLKDLRFSWINLTSGSWVPILKAVQKFEELDHLHLMWLQEASRKVYFLTQPNNEEDEEDAFAQFQNAMDDDLDDSDHESDDSEEMPDLEPIPGSDLDQEPPPVATVTATIPITPAVAPAPSDPMVEDLAEPAEPVEDPDFIPPGHEGYGEKGFYICLRGSKQLEQYLPRFIDEYNLGESLFEDQINAAMQALPLNGPGGLALNMLQAALGVPGVGPPGVPIGPNLPPPSVGPLLAPNAAPHAAATNITPGGDAGHGPPAGGAGP